MVAVPPDDRLLADAARWRRDGHGVAIAVVIRTWGSSPRRPGSLMLIRDDGLIAGSVSGGCVEGAVKEAACQSLIDGQSQRLDFGVADETAWQVGLSCGGEVSVWVCPYQAIANDLWDEMSTRLSQRISVHLNCDLTPGGGLSLANWNDADQHRANTMPADEHCFLLSLMPLPRLYLIGAVHISQHLAPMALAAGYDVTVIDPRQDFANPQRFPDVDVITGWPDEVLNQPAYPLDENTALVTLTHDPKIDDAALIAALGQPVFHLAALGSRRTHSKRCERLEQAGCDAAAISRIEGPAGMDIHATTAAEIAVSILASVIKARRYPKPQGNHEGHHD